MIDFDSFDLYVWVKYSYMYSPEARKVMYEVMNEEDKCMEEIEFEKEWKEIETDVWHENNADIYVLERSTLLRYRR